MLSNLIQNCINHNPHGCEITVEILKENDTCIISVIDNGGGMTSTQIEKMNSGIFLIICTIQMGSLFMDLV